MGPLKNAIRSRQGDFGLRCDQLPAVNFSPLTRSIGVSGNGYTNDANNGSAGTCSWGTSASRISGLRLPVELHRMLRASRGVSEALLHGDELTSSVRLLWAISMAVPHRAYFLPRILSA